MALQHAEGRRSTPTSRRSWPRRAGARGGAIDPLAAYRASGYRARKAEERPQQASFGGGIV